MVGILSVGPRAHLHELYPNSLYAVYQLCKPIPRLRTDGGRYVVGSHATTRGEKFQTGISFKHKTLAICKTGGRAKFNRARKNQQENCPRTFQVVVVVVVVVANIVRLLFRILPRSSFRAMALGPMRWAVGMGGRCFKNPHSMEFLASTTPAEKSCYVPDGALRLSYYHELTN